MIAAIALFVQVKTKTAAYTETEEATTTITNMPFVKIVISIETNKQTTQTLPNRL